MCGRYTLYSSGEELSDYYNAEISDLLTHQANYNVAPSSTMPVVLQADETLRIVPYRWGLIPHWSTDEQIGYKMINARAETIHNKPAYRKAFASQRCIVPSNGFYEWKKDKKQKQPWYIYLKDNPIMSFAGLFDEWISPDGEVIPSYTIITTEADESISDIHHRMPVILQPDYFRQWLNPDEHDKEKLKHILQSTPAGEIRRYQVSSAVNKPINNYAELLQEAPLPGSQQSSQGDLFG